VTYGLTEAGPRVTTLPSEQFLERAGSVGLPIRGVELDVRREDGRSCRPGEIGVLVVRTPSLMTGYLGSDADVAPHGWLTTGDLAARDAEGFVTLAGRADRQTKIRGRRVNPAMVERCLESHPGVVCAQVVVDAAAERLVATAHVRPGSPTTLECELGAHCRRNLPDALVPARIEVIAEDAFYFKNRRVEFSRVPAVNER
jgi:acyl-coenzyme A synthetase/AMP-(fatty) acid ligase